MCFTSFSVDADVMGPRATWGLVLVGLAYEQQSVTNTFSFQDLTIKTEGVGHIRIRLVMRIGAQNQLGNSVVWYMGTVVGSWS